MFLTFRILCCPGQEIPARLFQDPLLGRKLTGRHRDLQRVQDGELWPENAGRVEGDLYRVSIG